VGVEFAKLSPNGQWLAYNSDESKRPEVYVQSFPNTGGKWQVSANGGIRPIWSRDGKECRAGTCPTECHSEFPGR
jgi:Tol biopolymer transport system component